MQDSPVWHNKNLQTYIASLEIRHGSCKIVKAARSRPVANLRSRSRRAFPAHCPEVPTVESRTRSGCVQPSCTAAAASHWTAGADSRPQPKRKSSASTRRERCSGGTPPPRGRSRPAPVCAAATCRATCRAPPRIMISRCRYRYRYRYSP